MIDFNLSEELKPEIIGDEVYIGNGNIFSLVPEEDIERAERLLGFPFPDQLRKFYQNIGYGQLTTPHNPPEGYDFYGSNEILPPLVVANFSKGILRWDGQDHWMAEPTYEILESGDLPFFEMYDSTHFLVMKINSSNPDAVWTPGSNPIKIEDSFEKFIWRLYYESPEFYGDIIEDYLAAHKNFNSSAAVYSPHTE